MNMDINININGQLLDAVRDNNLLNVQQLVLNGADVNCQNIFDHTPLHYAESIEIAQLLVANGADVNYCSNDGSTPLHYAKTLEIVQFLVLNGADVNCRNCYGSTPLHYAETLEIVQFLVLNGADVNCMNNAGATPLYLYMSRGLEYASRGLEYAKILLENGADMHIKNAGRSAYDIAIRSTDNELIELFEHYNAISKGLDIKEPCVE